MSSNDLKQFRDFHWLVADPDLLGGKLAVRGTRLSAAHILDCLAEGMTVSEIEETYGTFPHDAIPEVLRAAAEALNGQVEDRLIVAA